MFKFSSDRCHCELTGVECRGHSSTGSSVCGALSLCSGRKVPGDSGLIKTN